MSNITAQIVGLFAFVLVVLSFQINNRKKILYLLLVGNLLFFVHFYLLNSPTGAVMNIIGALRGYIFGQRTEKKWFDNQRFLYLFIVILSIAGFVTWEGWFSLLPTIAASIQTIGLWAKNTTKIRIICLSASPLWMIYNIHNGSIAGILTEAFMTISIVIAIIRFEILKANKEV